MYFKQFFDDKLAQYSYIVGCQKTGTAIVIDPLRDIDQYIDAAVKEDLTIVAAADTHIHADFISGLREFAERGVVVYASDEGDDDWKYEWLTGSNYKYRLLKDGDEFSIGNVKIRAWHTPGHTPEHLSYFIIDGAAADEPLGMATGDFIFVGDVGRPDLLESAAGMKDVMEPSARLLYKSVESFKSVPEYIQIWPGHGAGSACGKALGSVPDSTVGYELRYNNSIKSASSEDSFVSFILEDQPEPPYYFARMKRDNKSGPNLVRDFPTPHRLTLAELERLAGDDSAVFIDTRSKNEYAAGHIPGSLLSTLNRKFNTVVGSYVEENYNIYLVVEEHRLTEAVTDLIRIGLDHVTGYITPEDLELYREREGALGTLQRTKFSALSGLNGKNAIVDVRFESEFDDGHVPGAINIAYTRLIDRVDEIPNDKKLYVYCQSGERSATASAFLLRMGYDVVLIDDSFDNFNKQ